MRSPDNWLIIAALLSSFCVLTHTANSGVTFIYPNDSSHLTFNYIDTVEFVYSTPWPNVNIWVYCLDSTHSQYHDEYQTYGNPLAQSDQVTIEHIGSKGDLQGILQYPTPCWFKIADYTLGTGVDGNPDGVPGVVGGNFTMKSVDGVPTQTWSAGFYSGATTTAATTPGSSSGSSSTTSISSLSTGAKAGIGASVGVLGAAVGCLAIYIFILRRRLRLQTEEGKTLKAIKESRDYRDLVASKFTRKELPGVSVNPTFEADEGQPKGVAEPLQLDG